ncbi:MAG: DNA/RNA non-specific endonuclease [Tannerellaceae bacterium]|nr:DNA/RNA non-specific endonuclease [Tannerellaceae bacterium]
MVKRTVRRKPAGRPSRRPSRKKTASPSFWGALSRICLWALLLALAIVAVVLLYECQPYETPGLPPEETSGLTPRDTISDGRLDSDGGLSDGRLDSDGRLSDGGLDSDGRLDSLEIPRWAGQDDRTGEDDRMGEDDRVGEERVLQREGFTLSFNTRYRLSSWVAWVLTAEEAGSTRVARTDNFQPDPDLGSSSLQLADYKNSSYDRGHLAPAADMRWSPLAMTQSFYLSNICPQAPAFNRGIWAELEKCCRQWALTYGQVLIITGPLLTGLEGGNLEGGNPGGSKLKGGKLEGGKLPVPRFFFKVICRFSAPDTYYAIAFLLENRAYQNADWRTLALPVDSIETVTGLDFFSFLPDSLEETLEATVDTQQW